ncbi:MAG: inorganic pyrophosphatase [Gemmatimonadetes bacterium]|nr:inorganic diphosphatase [Gemmatimonadota bacterium]NIU77593.1 inorganic pyrophosphatase [Gammaproteobacteria bacterium]NIQ57427.1 inorganic diphosphatase [Gemmatimonadota bacterium]NIW37413.1 inorganic pyrophosphatase [Gemmatimonadota bacterium]NIX46778.1 inorganic pyrophosphatase [Gemmatimonadota bacterium]
MHPLHDLEPGPRPPDRLFAYIEIPRGERNKYEVDKETGVLKFDRLLYSAVHYPGDYGFVPRTLAEDGDALDVLVLITAPTVPGCLIEVRPLGMFQMRDEKGMDHKILAVPVSDPFMEGYQDLDDVPPHTLREIDHFFAVYKELEGKETVTGGWHGRDDSIAVIEAAIGRYDEQQGRAD